MACVDGPLSFSQSATFPQPDTAINTECSLILDVCPSANFSSDSSAKDRLDLSSARFGRRS